MSRWKDQSQEMAQSYDAESQTVEWYGPETAFALLFEHTTPGQSLLDIGIGTGLSAKLFHKGGLEIHGVDFSEEMLRVCEQKGFAKLTLHDVSIAPYPFASNSMDHAVCSGVIYYLPDPGAIFLETARILRPGGLFSFVVMDRPEGEDAAMLIPGERTGADDPLVRYRTSDAEIRDRLHGAGLVYRKCLTFSTLMGRDGNVMVGMRTYVAEKPAE